MFKKSSIAAFIVLNIIYNLKRFCIYILINGALNKTTIKVQINGVYGCVLSVCLDFKYTTRMAE